MLQIECHQCKQKFWIKGYSTLSSYDDPGEDVISDREDFGECCTHIQSGGTFDIVDSEQDDYDDYELDRHCGDDGT